MNKELNLPKLKYLISFLFSLFLIFTNIISTYALTTYHVNREYETITKGVEYVKDNRMTSIGILDVHVLLVDIADENISLRGVESIDNNGYRETVRHMLTDHNAVAGINSDFFHMTTKTTSFGALANFGEFIASGTTLNHDRDQYATFFIDEDENMFFSYFKMKAQFSNGTNSIDIGTINKVTALVEPVYINRNVGTNTQAIDDYLGSAIKLVVEDDILVSIAHSDQSVDIPENGYVILIYQSQYYDGIYSYFSIGDKVTFTYQASLDMDKIETAFSGGSMLLSNGAKATTTQDFPTGKHPRTAFGVSQDRSKAVLMVVDGRGDSVGADHNEMSVLMLEYGAYDAMHLDGGGSSTMVASSVDDSTLEVKNTVSEGSERTVTTSIGVFENHPEGALKELVVVPNLENTVLNRPIEFTIYGIDQYNNKVEIPKDELYLETVNMSGSWSGLNFTPTSVGKFKVVAIYKNYAGISNTISAQTISKLTPLSDINLAVGGTTNLSAKCTDADGFEQWISYYVDYEIEDSSIGKIDGITFTALKAGSTVIKCSKDGHVAYIKVTVGGATPVDTPSSSLASDPWKKSISYNSNGSTFVNVVGNLVYSGSNTIDTTTYNSNRERARVALNSGASIGIYGGSSSMSTALSIPTITWNSGYSFSEQSKVSIATITSSKGGITATDPTQYTNLQKDVMATSNSNILIVTDKTPASFTSSTEADYFRNVLEKFVKEGKNVIVIVNSGESTWTVIKNGVRYINLPNLWLSNGSINSNVSMAKLEFTNNSIYYDIVNF